jgi:hypothetical protein
MTSHLQADVASLDQFTVIPRHHGETGRTVTTEAEHLTCLSLGSRDDVGRNQFIAFLSK